MVFGKFARVDVGMALSIRAGLGDWSWHVDKKEWEGGNSGWGDGEGGN
jgi:hypothetical protein